MPSDNSRDPFSILGLPADADQKEVAAAYRRHARRWHPDHNRDPRAKVKMQEINWAYKALRDPELRSHYARRARYAAAGGPASGRKYSPPRDWQSSEPSRASRVIARIWRNVFAHEIRPMRGRAAPVVAGSLFVVVIYAVCARLSDSNLSLMIALPAIWLIVIFQFMSPGGRSSSLIGTTIGLLLSTLVCSTYTLRLNAGAVGADSMALTSNFMLLFAIPVSSLLGSFVGMLGIRE